MTSNKHQIQQRARYRIVKFYSAVVLAKIPAIWYVCILLLLLVGVHSSLIVLSLEQFIPTHTLLVSVK